MRKELEPDMEIAEKLYSQIKGLIEKYTEYCDEYGDGEEIEYKNLENKLYEITGKDISQYNLSEYSEEEGLEVLSFRISLPEPKIVSDITEEEVTEIVKRIKSDVFQESNENNFKNIFHCYLGDYYHKLLKRNFKKYKYEYFNSQKGNDGKYFKYTTEEIARKIWGT